MRGPAAAAGLAFEADAEKSALDERLLADARTADSLPLLQFTLRRLYEQRADATGEAKLTHAAYDALGGLVGAIAAEAVDALLKARILIARTDAAGRPTVRLAHDAVLVSWPRAAAAAQASRDFYRVRADVEDYLRAASKKPGEFLFTSLRRMVRCMTTRQ